MLINSFRLDESKNTDVSVVGYPAEEDMLFKLYEGVGKLQIEETKAVDNGKAAVLSYFVDTSEG